METTELKESWRKTLEGLGLDSLEKMLAYQGESMSVHRRAETFRIVLPQGGNIYLKRDYFTYKKEIIKDLLHFRRPASNCMKERVALGEAKAAGFEVPEVIGWGMKTFLGLPSQAALLLTEVPGESLEKILRREGRREWAIKRAEEELKRIQAAGLLWLDYKPEHFLMKEDGGVALLDLERMTATGKALDVALCKRQLEDFYQRVDVTLSKQGK